MRFLLFILIVAGGISMLMVPKYSKGVESSLAEEAAATAKMIATTNRMYSLDFQGRWTVGPIDNNCNSGFCAAPQRGVPSPSCNLISCNYLSKQDWDSKKFIFYALDPTQPPSDSNTCGKFPSSRSWAACAVRKTPQDGDKQAPKFSVGWAYAVAPDGSAFASVQLPGSEETPPLP
ncbi:MAG: hypothetical protein HY553_18655 [Elusimicrobia bacterium]|nr:hypothetical protein [Elusimicrobiota bacterium]